MALDHYAPCPCGSGKKLKFCKCIDQPQEFEKLIKLIDGDQHLAAVDRINQLLQKTPNAAWLLALKGELTLAMQEFDSFKDTANRFVRLKPDNPLAAMMMAIATSMDGEPPEKMAHHILAGLSEARENLPSLTKTALQILMQAMAAFGRTSMVGYWAEIFQAIVGPEAVRETPISNPRLNLLAKSPPRLLPVPLDAAYKERMAEVNSLVSSFRFAQAESKFRTILRDFPDEPCPLSHLLRSQCVQLQDQAAFRTAQKLSEHLQVSAKDRHYFRALSLELEPEQASLRSSCLIKYADIESEQKAEQALKAMPQIYVGTDSDEMRQYYAALVGDELPARQIFNVFDRPITETAASVGNREIASCIGVIATFGKQTDKSARVLLHDFGSHDSNEAMLKIAQELELGQEHEVPSMVTFVQSLTVPRIKAGQMEVPLTMEELGEKMIEAFLNTKLALFDGRSPAEVADDEKSRGDLLGLLGHFEGEQSIVIAFDTVSSIYAKLGLERPVPQLSHQDGQLTLETLLDLARVDPRKLDDENLKALLPKSFQVGAQRTIYGLCKEAVNREGLQADQNVQISALTVLMEEEADIHKKLEMSEQLLAKLEAAGAPVGRVVIQRTSMLESVGRSDEARRTFEEAMKKYPEDPYLMQFLQFIMSQQATTAAAGGGTMGMDQQLGSSAGADSQSSGLVLPGQDDPSSESSGKLWLPGS